MKHVVIVGGGFAGLNCARKLAAHPEIRITLIDKNNYQQFQPLLYQVAAGFLAPSNVAYSLRNILVKHPNVEVKMGEIVSADLATRTVTTEQGKPITAISWCWRRDRKPTSSARPAQINTAILCTPCMTPSCCVRASWLCWRLPTAIHHWSPKEP